jgi:N6-adenosine-specific RNA methylase IME4
MALEEICALPVADIAGDDSILFLWATSPKVGEALQVLEAWEFTYKTCLVWVKDKIGMGYWFRQQHEQLLLGTRGSPPTPETENRMSSVIDARRSKKHSEKPIAFYELIESMYPEYREREKIELFQRIPREGWAGWGNEVTENGSA